MNLIRKVTYHWPFGYGSHNARGGFTIIARMKGLQKLYIRVDEAKMVNHMLYDRHFRQHMTYSNPTPQQKLAILRHPGMSALLSISGLLEVSFKKALNSDGRKEAGPIPGGVLETQILPKLLAPKQSRSDIS